MTTVRVVVVDESGHPLVGVTVAAYSLANFPLINARAVTDAAGSVTLTTDGPSFYDAFDRRGISFRDRSYYGKVQIQIVSFGSNMNADYVVDKSGAGTHLTLFGATGALQAAMASGTSAFIWLCTTHTETVSAQEVLPDFSLNQQIIVASGTRERAVISVALAGATPLIQMPFPGGVAGSSISFKSFRFMRVSGTGALIGPEAGGPSLPNIEFENMDFKNGGSTFDALVGGSLLTQMTTGALTVRGCTGDGVLVINQLGATSNSIGSFLMEDCSMTLEGVNRQSSSTSVDWGMSGGGVMIRNNILTITSYLWRRNYDMTFFHVDNNVIYHTGATECIKTGLVQTGSNVHICNNSYQATTVGASFCGLVSATSNIKNVIVTGNSLDGPGSGTAIYTVFVNTGALPDQIILAPNVYRDWTTNFDGTAGGATDDFTDVNPDGTSALAAPNAVNYLIGTADTRLPSAIVVGTVPGGELGGTWPSPTVDLTHAGSPHHTESHATRHSQAGADVLNVADLGSGAATSGFVATADGLGGVDWLVGGGGGGGGGNSVVEYAFAPDASPTAAVVAGSQQGNIYHSGANTETATAIYVDAETAPGASGLPITIQYGDTNSLDTVAVWTDIVTVTLSSAKSITSTTMTNPTIPANRVMRMNVGTIVGSPSDVTVLLLVNRPVISANSKVSYIFVPDAAPTVVVAIGNQQGNIYHSGAAAETATRLYVDAETAPGAAGLPITIEYGDTNSLDTVTTWTTIATVTLSSAKSISTTTMTNATVPANRVIRMNVGTIVGSPSDVTITLEVDRATA